MPKPDVFAEKKRKVLQDLNRPQEEYTDRSPIGAVDANIREVVDRINEFDGLVTTSSCAGRVSVYLEGDHKLKEGKDHGNVTAASGQGKGGGKWLYVSHDPIDVANLHGSGALQQLLGISKDAQISFPPPDEPTRLVHFKFEPMILHILTSSLTDAQRCHSAAMSAGFRESGITGVTGSDPTPHVGIRTQGLALESIIAYQDSSGTVHPMVEERYLRTLLDLANQRFDTNTQRKKRFALSLLHQRDGLPKKGGDADWESADARRKRKRAEGLQRKQELQRQRESTSIT